MNGRIKRLERILQSRNRSELNKDDNQEMKIFLAENPPTVATSPPRAESTQLDITTTPSMPSISVAPPVDVSVESPTLPKNTGGTQMEIREYEGIQRLSEDLSFTGVVEPVTGKRRRTNVPKRLSTGLKPAKST